MAAFYLSTGTGNGTENVPFVGGRAGDVTPQTHSCSSSSFGLMPMNDLMKNTPLSKQWCLVDQTYMDSRKPSQKRSTTDPYESWKYDVKCQVSNIERKLNDLFERYPPVRNRSSIPADYQPTLTSHLQPFTQVTRLGEDKSEDHFHKNNNYYKTHPFISTSDPLYKH